MGVEHHIGGVVAAMRAILLWFIALKPPKTEASTDRPCDLAIARLSPLDYRLPTLDS